MRTLLRLLGLLALLTILPASLQMARAQDNGAVSFQTFYDQLAGEGTWIQTDQYGYVFQPTVTDPNWQPYTYGRWVSTDDGLLWQSDEPFGWATYHYGRWINLDNYGWVWVPGYTWAPAWVSWRQSDDYYGWAPLPPESGLGIDYFDGGGFGLGLYLGFHIGDDCDTAYGIGPGCYNFCSVGYIGDRYPWHHFANRYNNYALINRTRNITNINVNNHWHGGRFGRVHAGGPDVARMNAHSHTPLQHLQLAAATERGANGRIHGNDLSVYAPKIDPNTARNARPHHVSSTIAQATPNRGIDIRHPLAVNAHLRPQAANASQLQAARIAERDIPASAKVATVSTRPTMHFHQPLTAYHANESAAHQGAEMNAPQHAVNFTSTPIHAQTPATEAKFTGERPGHSSVTAESAFTGHAGNTRLPDHTAVNVHSQAFHSTPVANTPHIENHGVAGIHHQAHPSSPVASSWFNHSNGNVSAERHVSPMHQNAPQMHVMNRPQMTYHSSTPQHFNAPRMSSAPHMNAAPHMSAPHVSAQAPHSSGGGRPAGGPQHH